MSEKITVYNLKNPEHSFPMDRSAFYKEQTDVFFEKWETNKSL